MNLNPERSAARKSCELSPFALIPNVKRSSPKRRPPPRPARRNPRGLFFTFEGIDGCGKTTQLELFERHLKRARLPVVVTREPGGTELGERIRKLVLPSAPFQVDPRAEVLLLFASRAQNVAQVILPALHKGYLVLCDRFTDASLAYQGYGRGIPLASIRQLHRLACQGVDPDLTFVIDIDPATSVERARHRNVSARDDEGRFEQEAFDFYQRVQRGYHALARREPHRVKLIPGEDNIQSIHRKILGQANPLLERFRRRRAR